MQQSACTGTCTCTCAMHADACMVNTAACRKFWCMGGSRVPVSLRLRGQFCGAFWPRKVPWTCICDCVIACCAGTLPLCLKTTIHVESNKSVCNTAPFTAGPHFCCSVAAAAAATASATATATQTARTETQAWIVVLFVTSPASSQLYCA